MAYKNQQNLDVITKIYVINNRPPNKITFAILHITVNCNTNNGWVIHRRKYHSKTSCQFNDTEETIRLKVSERTATDW